MSFGVANVAQNSFEDAKDHPSGWVTLPWGGHVTVGEAYRGSTADKHSLFNRMIGGGAVDTGGV